MSIITPGCGFNRNTKKEILYGPLELGGASFRPLWVQQGVGQVTMFIRHWRKDTQAGKLSKIALAWLQAQAGVSFPILAFPSKTIPQLESKWIESMRSFLAKINATIIIDERMSPTLQRLHDFVIMDLVQESGKFTDVELRRLNYCRLFLRAETVSDVVTVDGSKLDQCKLIGNWSLQSSRHHGNAIYQERPNDAAWTLWRRANRLWSNKHGDLLQPLGDWVLDTIHSHHNRHFSYWSRNHLWIQSDNVYVRCNHVENKTYKESNVTINGNKFLRKQHQWRSQSQVRNTGGGQQPHA